MFEVPWLHVYGPGRRLNAVKELDLLRDGRFDLSSPPPRPLV